MKRNLTCKVAAPVKAIRKYSSAAYGCDFNKHYFSFSSKKCNSLHAISFLKDVAENIAVTTRSAKCRLKEIRLFFYSDT